MGYKIHSSICMQSERVKDRKMVTNALHRKVETNFYLSTREGGEWRGNQRIERNKMDAIAYLIQHSHFFDDEGEMDGDRIV